MLVTLILHERVSHWSRRLRPLAPDWHARIVETRSSEELAAAASGSACPIVLVEAGSRPGAAIIDVARARRAAPSGLILTLVEETWHELEKSLREAGATLILKATTPPPILLKTLTHWVEIARERCNQSGWAADRRREPEPWEALLPEAFAQTP